MQTVAFPRFFLPPSAVESTCPHPLLWSPQATTPSDTSRPLTNVSLFNTLARLFFGEGVWGGVRRDGRGRRNFLVNGHGAKFPLQLRILQFLHSLVGGGVWNGEEVSRRHLGPAGALGGQLRVLGEEPDATSRMPPVGLSHSCTQAWGPSNQAQLPPSLPSILGEEGTAKPISTSKGAKGAGATAGHQALAPGLDATAVRPPRP